MKQGDLVRINCINYVARGSRDLISWCEDTLQNGQIGLILKHRVTSLNVPFVLVMLPAGTVWIHPDHLALEVEMTHEAR